MLLRIFNIYPHDHHLHHDFIINICNLHQHVLHYLVHQHFLPHVDLHNAVDACCPCPVEGFTVNADLKKLNQLKLELQKYKFDKFQTYLHHAVDAGCLCLV